MMKRMFDCLLAGTGLVVSAPLWALAALAIKLEDRGAVLYRQERVTQRAAQATVWIAIQIKPRNDLPRQAEPIGVQTRRRQAPHPIARLNRGAIDDGIALDHADDGPRQIELPRRVQVG